MTHDLATSAPVQPRADHVAHCSLAGPARAADRPSTRSTTSSPSLDGEHHRPSRCDALPFGTLLTDRVLLHDSGRYFIGDYVIARDGIVAERRHDEAAGQREEASEPSEESAGEQAPRLSSACASGGRGGEPLDWSALQIGPLLGRGASGYVRRARLCDKLLAVKRIAISDDERRRQTFNEISTLVGCTDLSAANLITCYGVRCIEGNIEIAMEYMDLGSLGDLLCRHGPLPEEALGSLLDQTLAALHHLHKEKHAVHRDLKPQNLLLSSSGKCKLSDFGCVAELQDSFGKCGTFVGTVPYMSPERIHGGEYSYASDIWSLGLTIVEAALGHFPYARCNGYWGILQAVLHESSPTLPADRFSPDIVDLAAQCLQKAAVDRPTARELQAHPFLERCRASSFSTCEFLRVFAPHDQRRASGDASLFAMSDEDEYEMEGEEEEEEEEVLLPDSRFSRASGDGDVGGGAAPTVRHWGRRTEARATAKEAARSSGGEDPPHGPQLRALQAQLEDSRRESAILRQELQAAQYSGRLLQQQCDDAEAIVSRLKASREDRRAAAGGSAASTPSPPTPASASRPGSGRRLLLEPLAVGREAAMPVAIFLGRGPSGAASSATP